MRAALAAALALTCVPAALAAFREPIPTRVVSPTPAQQQRAVTRALRESGAVYCGGGHGDAVALTFDDGPGPYTQQILDELRLAGAHATFFLVGNRLQYWPALAAEEAQVGAVGNHTWSHPRLTAMRRWLVYLELARTESALDGKPRLFRPPYARHSPQVDAVARSLGLLEVFWDVDARDDVPHARVANVVRNVERGLRPGAIVILHDIHPWTAQALPQILTAIARRGLRAVSVPELLALDPPAPGRGCPY